MIPKTLNIPFTTLGQLIDYAADQYKDRQLWQSIDDGSVLTFAEMSAKTMTLAFALRDLGVKQGDHIAVMLPAMAGFALVWGITARWGVRHWAITMANRAMRE